MNPADLLHIVLPHLVNLITAWIRRPSSLAMIPEDAPALPLAKKEHPHPSAARIGLALLVLASVVPTLTLLGRRASRMRSSKT